MGVHVCPPSVEIAAKRSMFQLLPCTGSFPNRRSYQVTATVPSGATATWGCHWSFTTTLLSGPFVHRNGLSGSRPFHVSPPSSDQTNEMLARSPLAPS
jgi:hypothetical protein